MIRRFQELPVAQEEFWRATAISPAELEKWLAEQKEKLGSHTVATRTAGALAVIELTAVMKDGKKMLKRVIAPADGGDLGARFGGGMLA